MLPVRHFPQPSLTWLLASGPFETLEWEGVRPWNHPPHHFSLAKLASNTRPGNEHSNPVLADGCFDVPKITHQKTEKKKTQTPANTCKSWKLITWGNFWATRFHRFPPYQNCAFKDVARGWTRKSSVSGFGVWALPRKKHPGTRLKLPKHPANTQYCHKHPFVDHKHPMDVPPILWRKFLRGFINCHKLHYFPRLWIFRDLILWIINSVTRPCPSKNHLWNSADSADQVDFARTKESSNFTHRSNRSFAILCFWLNAPGQSLSIASHFGSFWAPWWIWGMRMENSCESLWILMDFARSRHFFPRILGARRYIWHHLAIDIYWCYASPRSLPSSVQHLVRFYLSRRKTYRSYSISWCKAANSHGSPMSSWNSWGF